MKPAPINTAEITNDLGIKNEENPPLSFVSAGSGLCTTVTVLVFPTSPAVLIGKHLSSHKSAFIPSGGSLISASGAIGGVNSDSGGVVMATCRSCQRFPAGPITLAAETVYVVVPRYHAVED